MGLADLRERDDDIAHLQHLLIRIPRVGAETRVHSTDAMGGQATCGAHRREAHLLRARHNHDGATG